MDNSVRPALPPTRIHRATYDGAISSIDELIKLEERHIELLRKLRLGLEQKRDKEIADAKVDNHTGRKP